MLVLNKKKYSASIFTTGRQGSICMAPINYSWADGTTLQRLPVRPPCHNRPLPVPANQRPAQRNTSRFPKRCDYHIVLQRPVLPVPVGNRPLPAPASQRPARRNTTHFPKPSGCRIILQKPALPVPAGNEPLPVPANQRPARQQRQTRSSDIIR